MGAAAILGLIIATESYLCVGGGTSTGCWAVMEMRYSLLLIAFSYNLLNKFIGSASRFEVWAKVNIGLSLNRAHARLRFVYCIMYTVK